MSDLEKRNSKATLEALRRFDSKLRDMQEKYSKAFSVIMDLQQKVSTLEQQINLVKASSIGKIPTVIGPTA